MEIDYAKIPNCSFPALTKISVSNWISSHQSLKRWILHKIIVQIPVGHHSVHLDTEVMTEIQLHRKMYNARTIYFNLVKWKYISFHTIKPSKTKYNASKETNKTDQDGNQQFQH